MDREPASEVIAALRRDQEYIQRVIDSLMALHDPTDTNSARMPADVSADSQAQR